MDATDLVALWHLGKYELGDRSMFKSAFSASAPMVLCPSYAMLDLATQLVAWLDALSCVASCQQIFS